MTKFIFAAIVSISNSAQALPLNFSQPMELSESFTTNYNFNGIAKTNICSAAIVKFRNTSDEEKAYLLTNGHCINMGKTQISNLKMPAPGEVIVDVPSSEAVDLLSDDGKISIGRIVTKRLLYATMTKTDLALYRLGKTIKELRTEYGIKPLVLSDRPAATGTPIAILSGYWRRGFTCSIEAYIEKLKEADWIFVDSLRYSREGCDVVGGTSGAPIISVTSGEVVGVNNTSNKDGGTCTLNNPCEESSNGSISVYHKRGYGQHVDWIYSCLSPSGEIDLKINGCSLPKPSAEKAENR